MKKSMIIETITFFYIILFLYTGISKLMDYAIFKEQIAESPLLKPIANFIATGLPFVEFLVVLMLIIPRWRLSGLYTSLALMLFFTIYIIAILLFNDQLPCSCGGIIEEMSWPQHIIFNIMLISLAIAAIVLERQIKIRTHLDLSLIGKIDAPIKVKGI